MRTIDATLKAALESGSYDPFFELRLMTTWLGDPDWVSATVTKYYLSPLGELEIVALFNTVVEDYQDGNYAVLRRGAIVEGVQYYLDTSFFTVETIAVDGYYMRVKANLLPSVRIARPGDDTYWNVLQGFCSDLGFAAARKDAADVFWENQFLPSGRMLTLNKARQIRSLLKQKFFMNCTDAGAETILFWSAKNYGSAPEYTITAETLVENVQEKTNNGTVGLFWRNQDLTVYRNPDTALPIYNLGFIADGGLIPVVGSITNLQDAASFVKTLSIVPKPLNVPINLDYLTGDYVLLTSSVTGLSALGYLLVTEYFDTAKSPSWGLKLELWDFIGTNEGGAMPSTIEAAASYTPLVTGSFDSVLSASDNNVQTAMETLNDHSHLALVTLAPMVGITGKVLALDVVTAFLYVWTGTSWYVVQTVGPGEQYLTLESGDNFLLENGDLLVFG